MGASGNPGVGVGGGGASGSSARTGKAKRSGAGSVAPSVGELWMSTLQRMSGSAAHEIKGALNGVSVNLEVVRSRAERADAPASSISSFAAAAANQLDAVIAFSEALLALTRPAREPVEIGVVVRHMGTLLASAGRSDARRLDVDPGLQALGTTSASGNAVRLAIGASLLAALETSPEVRCEATQNAGSGPAIRIAGRSGTPLAVDAATVAAVAAADIGLEIDSATISITFPH